jgi:hypothetical protein
MKYKTFLPICFVFTVTLLAVIAQTATAQCVPNPTQETAVGLQNASSHFLTFYIDGVNVGGVPSGDRSVDFVVLPGDHTLEAEAIVAGGRITASHTGVVPAGFVCTWTVTDPDPLQILVKVTGGGPAQVALDLSLRSTCNDTSVADFVSQHGSLGGG